MLDAFKVTDSLCSKRKTKTKQKSVDIQGMVYNNIHLHLPCLLPPN